MFPCPFDGLKTYSIKFQNHRLLALSVCKTSSISTFCLPFSASFSAALNRVRFFRSFFCFSIVFFALDTTFLNPFECPFCFASNNGAAPYQSTGRGNNWWTIIQWAFMHSTLSWVIWNVWIFPAGVVFFIVWLRVIFKFWILIRKIEVFIHRVVGIDRHDDRDKRQYCFDWQNSRSLIIILERK